MNAYRGEKTRVGVRQRQYTLTRLHLVQCGNQNPVEVCIPRAGQHRVPVRVEMLEVEVAVGVGEQGGIQGSVVSSQGLEF